MMENYNYEFETINNNKIFKLRWTKKDFKIITYLQKICK